MQTQRLLFEQDKVSILRVGNRLTIDCNILHLVALEKTGHLITEERPVELYEKIHSFTLKA